MHQLATWYGCRPQPRGLCVRWICSPRPQKGGIVPQILGPYLLRPNDWMDQPRRLCVRWGPSPSPKGAEPHPIFGPRLLWPNGCMDQDATWYGSRPRPTRHFVRCGPSYPQKKAHPPHPIFGPCLLWPNGWMDEDAAGTEVDLGPGHIVLYGVPAPAKVAEQPHYFRPMSIVATVAHLSYS